jgi:hypothetical protein
MADGSSGDSKKSRKAGRSTEGGINFKDDKVTVL